MKNKQNKFLIFLFVIFGLVFFVRCKNSDNNTKKDVGYNSTQGKETILGISFLTKICGLWHGPVFSDTPAGSFKEWYVDFRPVSSGKVAQFSTLDPDTKNYMSFFIVKYRDELRIAQRTYGVFQEKGCVTYEMLVESDPKNGYYKFSDFKAGDKRAYTEYTIGDKKFVMKVYTSKFNTKNPPTLHSKWEAKLGDKSATQESIDYFKFPQPKEVVDFTHVFDNVKECVYFDLDMDPYPTNDEDYLGKITVNIKIDNSLEVKKNHELFLLLTTQSLFNGLKYKKDNLRYISKYVFLSPDTRSYTIDAVHPGKYYLYSYNDINGDRRHLSGDYMSSDLNNIVTVPINGKANVDTIIDFVIP